MSYADFDLGQWLRYIATLHPKGMDLSLTRIRCIAQDMELLQFACPVVMVAGTNGKGSLVCLLQNIYLAQGYKVASYTSPHLHAFNERIQCAGVPITTQDLLTAFAAVESARQKRSLTLFEFETLAALYHIKKYSPDVVLLEVGLGGRLDAVNIIDSDVSVITSISLDHIDRLGADRESIAYEKAGIIKANKTAIVGEPNPPQSIFDAASKVGSEIKLINKDFGYKDNASSWSYMGGSLSIAELSKPQLRLDNAATSLAVVESLLARLPVSHLAINQGLKKSFLSGRYERRSSPCSLVFDVAHNPGSVISLANQIKSDPLFKAKKVAVVGMLKDKLIKESLEVMCPLIDVWYVASLDGLRGASADLIVENLKTCGVKNCYTFESVAMAMKKALQYVGSHMDYELLVFGSFHTVAKAQHYLQFHEEI